jgi:rRNA maturation endonuclease Nob1
MTNKNSKWPKWIRDDKSVVSCTEKVKVMNENFEELKQIAQDAFDDGVLMEVSEEQMKKVLYSLIEALESPIKKK